MLALLARAAVLASISAARLLAQPMEQDLWIGVLRHESVAADANAKKGELWMSPVAALVGGAWHGDLDLRGEWQATPSGSEWRWEPAKSPLPRRWVAWMAGGRSVPFRYVGRPKNIGMNDALGVGTGIVTTPPSWYGEVMGIAVSGRVDVRMFADVGEAARVVPEAMQPALLAAERLAIRTKPDGYSDEWYQPAADFPLDRLPTLHYEVRRHRVAIRGDGTRTVVLSRFKSLAASEGCTVVESEGAIDITSDGRVTLLYANAGLNCNELPITYSPIAILERGGKTCWLGENQYEDGSRYTLTRSGEPDEADPPTCEIR